ncbi:MAG: ArsR family transcriptional regulator [Methanobacteriota archaeon]|nr:MAG: ArsR family transcriptional regulator [Euryarchaeota archaeon]
MLPEISQIELLAKLFRGFGDKTRLAILKSLADSPKITSELVKELELPQSTVSTHLGCLRECNLVTAKKQGRKVTYSLTSDLIKEIIDLAEQVLKTTYQAIWACVNYKEEDKI